MHLRNLPLAASRIFEAAVRQLSFKHAVEELYGSATTVGNQIRRFERDLGCKLFIRKTRAVVPTDAGQSLSKILTKSPEDMRIEMPLPTQDMHGSHDAPGPAQAPRSASGPIAQARPWPQPACLPPKATDDHSRSA